MNTNFIRRPMAVLFVFGATACQTSAVNHLSPKISYEDLTPSLRLSSENATKCALAMKVLDSEDYKSIDEVYFNDGSTYGELMSALDEPSKNKLLEIVSVRVDRYAALHYKGDVVPVMFEYVFSRECEFLYFSDGFKSKYSDLIKSLDKS